MMRLLVAASLALMCLSNMADAKVLEEMLHIPVSLKMTGESRIERQMVLTVVRDSQQKKSPFIIILHGRPENPIRFAVMGQQRYPINADYFVAHGFVVLIPTRIGYGLTGGPDVEYTGECESKNYLKGATPVVSETRQILSFARKLPYVDTSRGLVVGESVGGMDAIAIASSGIKSIKGAINISGGDGGSLNHLEQPCSPGQLRDAFAAYGKTNHIPTLWMYSLNDRYWGTGYPKQWFAAFVDEGGNGAFVTLPADKNNGHYIFTRNPADWHPAFEAFIRKLGF
ncbi:MAG TPA: hypothetical protein VMV35_04720 [Halothiobacillus sp.]|nr:hypothetical protein [Halothiobacillus sp.]